MPWLFEQITSKDYLYIQDVAKLAEEAVVEKMLFIEQGIQSVLCLPIFGQKGQLIGFFGFDSIRKVANWSIEEIRQLRLLTNTIAYALERLSMQQNLQEALTKLQQFELAIQQVAIVVHLDRNGMMQMVNDNLLRISKHCQETLLGQHYRVLAGKTYDDQFFKRLERHLAQGKTWRAEVDSRAKDGSRFWLDMWVIPIKNSKAEVLSYLSISSDITERKSTEPQLNKTLAALKEAQLIAQIGRW